MKAIEAIFDTIFIGIVVGIVALGTLFVVKGGEVDVYENTPINHIAAPVKAMVDGKTHHMFENQKVIIDISYNK